MPASASGLFYEANINRAVVDLALRANSENPCLDHLQRLERATQEWIAIIMEWRVMAEGDNAGLLDAALVTLRETRQNLRQVIHGVPDSAPREIGPHDQLKPLLLALEAFCDGHVRAFAFSAACRSRFCMTTPSSQWPASLVTGQRQRT